MFRKYGILLVLLAIGLSLTAFSSPPSAAIEGEGNPWWIWVLVFLALVAFVVFAFWWWMRSGEEEEEELGTTAKPEPVAATRAVGIEASEPEAPPPPDDLKRIEGIGPKISGVFQAAGIATFAQLAATDVERLKQILEAENPNLLRLADPTTWPEQAKLAAAGDWSALEKLQGELKGGRQA